MVKFQLFEDVVNDATRAEYEKQGKKCISLDSFKNFLNDNKGQDLQFDISTLGGDLATAITIHDLIKAYPKKTVANIIGLTASAGTVIAEACDSVVMSENALFLIHNGWKNVTGNIYDFQKAVEDMSKTDAIMVKMYREKTGLPDAKIIDIMKASDWLTAYEALEYKFVDKVEETQNKIAASALIEGAQGKVNNQLLNKLQEKMNLFGKKEERKPAFPLALKDGNFLAMNAEEAAKGVEVTPLGVFALEDGDYQLTDGRMIRVIKNADGSYQIEDVMEEQPAAQLSAEQMIETVAQMLTASEAKIESLIEVKLKPLSAMVSTHKPEKIQPVVNASANVNAFISDDLTERIEAKRAEQKAAAKAKRGGN